MLRAIMESITYRQSSDTTREICRSLSNEWKVREARIYSLIRGRRALNADEQRVLFRLQDMGIIKAIRQR